MDSRRVLWLQKTTYCMKYSRCPHFPVTDFFLNVSNREKEKEKNDPQKGLFRMFCRRLKVKSFLIVKLIVDDQYFTTAFPWIFKWIFYDNRQFIILMHAIKHTRRYRALYMIPWKFSLRERQRDGCKWYNASKYFIHPQMAYRRRRQYMHIECPPM